MSQPLHWLGKYFFYAIGNTPATSLTRDLSPQTPANILLLGCGDPRNVLFSVFNEDKKSDRRLDITCSDIDPAIIGVFLARLSSLSHLAFIIPDIAARNVLLLTMIIDNDTSLSTMWKIFFDMKIDRDSYSRLIGHCKKLWEYSGSQKAWLDSPYGATVKFSTLHTLEQARQRWKFYIEMENLPTKRQNFIREAFTKLVKDASRRFNSINSNISSARAAGPLLYEASPVYGQHALHYISTGVSSTESTVLASATLINPTFAYSFAGEGCNVHYGTSPLTPFHTSALFANATQPLRMSDVLQAAQKQFGEWCDAYRSRAVHPSKIVLRFLVGEATAVCGAFQSLNATQSVHTRIPVSQWRTSVLMFDEAQYSAPSNACAPTTFNVVDTTNLIDHVGLLNILVAALPLRTATGVIYTESLLYKGKREDAAKEFGARLFADLGTMALLLGVAPVDYLSGFCSRSNTNEILLNKTASGAQFHQVTTWKAPTSSDVSVNIRPAVVFDNVQLGTLLWNIYRRIFEDENAMTVLTKYVPTGNVRAIANSKKIMYNRESFVLFLKITRGNLVLSAEDWEAVMKTFFRLQDEGSMLPTDTAHWQDFYSYLYKHNVYTLPIYREPLRRTGRFSEWPSVPHLVRVVLIVPRSVLEDVFNDPDVATPVLQCDVRGMLSTHVFSSVHAAFGRVSSTGTKSSPRISFEEDKEGWKGRSPLVVSFTMPTRLLVNFEPQRNLLVNLSISGTVSTIAQFAQKLGISLNVYGAKLSGGIHVEVLPEPISHASGFPAPALSTEPLPHRIGSCGPVTVSLDGKHEIVNLFSCRMSVENPIIVHSFGSQGAIPNVKQISPCVVRLTVSGIFQDFVFPYPVRGSDHRLRLVRKSLYIELLVPPSGPFQSEGMRTRPFPVTLPDSSSRHPDIQAWNIHHVNLSRLPVLDCSRPKELSKWFHPHVALMMSARERELRDKNEPDTLMFVKERLQQIMAQASGFSGGKAHRLFSLMDRAARNVDTLLFISDLRFDQSAYTVVCDAFVLPLTDELMTKQSGPFARLINGEGLAHIRLREGEVASWKHLIPAFVERCRISWMHTENCEYKAQGSIPLTEKIDHSPLCSCGQGKDVEGMLKNPLWRPFAPSATRIALSPLFAVTYLDPIM
ncbi:hypothetical protein BDP27DRAFT_1425084 [Rhodocollybia butyracea]|uniref:DUF4470 domain-containing protein n=1 Tax=Rhodocollybia butyracea TaxID=206335 RepID=A0A9P5U2Y4_9AGAR|nr:hypothetical protein BDP27DRAFT_1425084 [Rhodocollybia butyracea]